MSSFATEIAVENDRETCVLCKLPSVCVDCEPGLCSPREASGVMESQMLINRSQSTNQQTGISPSMWVSIKFLVGVDRVPYRWLYDDYVQCKLPRVCVNEAPGLYRRRATSVLMESNVLTNVRGDQGLMLVKTDPSSVSTGRRCRMRVCARSVATETTSGPLDHIEADAAPRRRR